jgi:hypothetical protein
MRFPITSKPFRYLVAALGVIHRCGRLICLLAAAKKDAGEKLRVMNTGLESRVLERTGRLSILTSC